MSAADSPAERIFAVALEMTDPAARSAYLERVCAGDEGLRREVASLLMAYEQSGDFLDDPAAPAAAEPAGTTSATTLPSERPGDRIGRFKLLEQIGEGGMGTVWMAEQEEPVRRLVALKVIKLGMDTKEVVVRFEAERQALALMDHPNIARVFDGGATDTGRPYFVMELVRGLRITQYCDEVKLPPTGRLDLFIQVCQALQHAHQKGIIHRDLKPSNILVTLHDDAAVPKVIDFGIAKATDQRLTDKTLFTRFQQLLGTPAYMSPEQAGISNLDVDTRSDIYSLGVLLYELLTGKTPFDAEELFQAGLEEMRRTILHKEPVRPSTRLRAMRQAELTTTAQSRRVEPPRLINLLSGDLDWIVMKCLEKDRTRRYETAAALAADLQRHRHHEPVLAGPPSRLYRCQKFVRRNKVLFSAGVAVAAALMIGLVISFWLLLKETEARRRASRAEQAEIALRRKAEANAIKSGQIAKFLRETLQGVQPSVALGRDTTMLREILDKTGARIAAELRNQPEVEAEIRFTLGQSYYDLREFAKAQEMYTESLRLQRQFLGSEQVVAKTLKSLALARWQLGDLADAEAKLYEALALQRKLATGPSLDVAETLSHLVGMLRRGGDLTAAEDMLREVLTIHRARHGEEHSDIALDLADLALIRENRGDLAGAEALYRQALAMQKKLLGELHPNLVAPVMNLGMVLEKRGDFAGAEAQLRESLALRRKLFGQQSYDVAIALNNYGQFLIRRGNLPEAEAKHREALAINRKVFGNVHAHVAGSLVNLARVVRSQGDLDSAESLLREAVSIARQISPRAHPDPAEPAHSLADLRRHRGDTAEAEQFYREAVQLARRASTNSTPELERHLYGLADCFLRQGRYLEAEAGFRESLGIARQHFASQPPQLEIRLNALADVRFRQGHYPEAESLWTEALAIGRAHFTNDPPRLEFRFSSLAEVLYRQGKFAQGEPLYRELWQSRQARLPPTHEDVLGPLASLARLLTDWVWAERHVPPSADSVADAPAGLKDSRRGPSERAREAEKLLRECLAIRTKSLPAPNWRRADTMSRLGAALVAVVISGSDLPTDARLAKLVEAERFLIESEATLRSHSTVEPKYKRETLERLVRLYEVWDELSPNSGNAEKAAEWRRKLATFDEGAGRPATRNPVEGL